MPGVSPGGGLDPPERLAELRQEADRHPDEDVWRNFRLHPDLVLAEGWWLTRTGRPRSEPEIRVDQVRDLVGEIAGAPFEARRRVFVIDDAHTMNDAAQNALLKSLEEPPPRSHVILVSSAASGLRPTIRSRCQRLRFGPLSRAVIGESLRLDRGLGPEQAGLQAALAGGSLAAALSAKRAPSCAARRAADPARGGLGAGRPRAHGSGRGARADRGPGAPAHDLALAAARPRGPAGREPRPRRCSIPTSRRGWRPSPPGRLGERATSLGEEAGAARAALRGFASKLLTFDRLVEALAGD